MKLTFQIGDYAETDRHYGQVVEVFWGLNGKVQHQDCELVRLECLHGPQRSGCEPNERVCATQLKPAPSPEELALSKLGDDYL